MNIRIVNINKKIIILSIIVLFIGVIQYWISYNVYLKYYSEPMKTAFDKIYYDLIKTNPNEISSNREDITKIINNDLNMFEFKWIAIFKNKTNTTGKQFSYIDQVKTAEYFYSKYITQNDIVNELTDRISGRGWGYPTDWEVKFQYKVEDPRDVFERYSRFVLLLCLIIYWVSILFTFGLGIYNNRKINSIRNTMIFATIGVLGFALYFNK